MDVNIPRLRYLADGAVFGTRAFVIAQLETYRKRTGRRQRLGPCALPPVADWGDLVTMRGLRRQRLG